MFKKEKPQINHTDTSGKSVDHNSGPQRSTLNKKQIIIITGIIIVIVLAILAVPYYKNYVEPFNRTLISIDGIKINMRYFIERTRIAGSDVNTMLYQITDELVVKLAAPQYGIQVTESDIDTQLRQIASEGEENISDIEYKEWYRQQLNNSKASESMFREIIGNNLLIYRMEGYLADRVPNVAEQVLLNIIVVQNYDDANKTIARIQAGEKFADVAKEVSLDSTTKEKGGEYGWIIPKLSLFETFFSNLKINEVSQAIPYYSESASLSPPSSNSIPSVYYILMISQIDTAHPIDEENMARLKSRALEFWLPIEYAKHDIKYNYNAEILAWLNWQLQKSSNNSGSQTSTATSSAK